MQSFNKPIKKKKKNFKLKILNCDVQHVNFIEWTHDSEFLKQTKLKIKKLFILNLIRSLFKYSTNNHALLTYKKCLNHSFFTSFLYLIINFLNYRNFKAFIKCIFKFLIYFILNGIVDLSSCIMLFSIERILYKK